jgi:hypothetical protein
MNFGMSYADGISANLTRALNALRCALVNVGDNAWNLIASLYWIMVGVGQKDVIEQYLNEGYKWICTCGKDVEGLLSLIGGGGEDENKDDGDTLASSCSEKAAVNKSNAEEDREKKRQKELDEKAEEEERLNAEAKANETRNALAGKSAGELEAAQSDAFEAYQAKAEELASKDQPSDEDKLELEELRRAYEATRTAKANIVRDGLTQSLWEAKDEDGLDGLRAVIREASQNQLALAKKYQEFP